MFINDVLVSGSGDTDNQPLLSRNEKSPIKAVASDWVRSN